MDLFIPFYVKVTHRCVIGGRISVSIAREAQLVEQSIEAALVESSTLSSSKGVMEGSRLGRLFSIFFFHLHPSCSPFTYITKLL